MLHLLDWHRYAGTQSAVHVHCSYHQDVEMLSDYTPSTHFLVVHHVVRVVVEMAVVVLMVVVARMVVGVLMAGALAAPMEVGVLMAVAAPMVVRVLMAEVAGMVVGVLMAAALVVVVMAHMDHHYHISSSESVQLHADYLHAAASKGEIVSLHQMICFDQID